MPGTLILLFHPAPARSHANAALGRAAARLAGADIVDMQATYPDAAIDTDAEVERLHRADRLVLQFPLQWYSTPPLLKAWQDAVLTRMFYLRPQEGAALRGMPLMLATTAGNHAAAYGPGGENRFTLEELFRPLQATAHRCGLRWSAPFSLFSADRLDDAALAAAGERYLSHLAAWQAEAMHA
ncbi:flavodoxin-like protein [Acetobacteraceae bacterium AT-5844]|nr:flavodoxin-like protein [Acetobacteraceae bacterium AT-5844]